MSIDLSSPNLWPWAEQVCPGVVAVTQDPSGAVAFHTAGPIFHENAKKYLCPPYGKRVEVTMNAVGDTNSRNPVLIYHPDRLLQGQLESSRYQEDISARRASVRPEIPKSDKVETKLMDVEIVTASGDLETIQIVTVPEKKAAGSRTTINSVGQTGGIVAATVTAPSAGTYQLIGAEEPQVLVTSGYAQVVPGSFKSNSPRDGAGNKLMSVVLDYEEHIIIDGEQFIKPPTHNKIFHGRQWFHGETAPRHSYGPGPRSAMAYGTGAAFDQWYKALSGELLITIQGYRPSTPPTVQWGRPNGNHGFNGFDTDNNASKLYAGAKAARSAHDKATAPLETAELIEIVTAAVAEATAPLVTRMKQLEAKLASMESVLTRFGLAPAMPDPLSPDLAVAMQNRLQGHS